MLRAGELRRGIVTLHGAEQTEVGWVDLDAFTFHAIFAHMTHRSCTFCAMLGSNGTENAAGLEYCALQ